MTGAWGKYGMDRGLEVLRRLNNAGYEAYFVGGCVRDSLMPGIVGKAGADMRKTAGSMDIDVTTDASPEQVKDVFADMRTVDTGIKHGTVTVVLPPEKDDGGGSRSLGSDDVVGMEKMAERQAGNDGLTVEVTTYRTEAGYSDGRHPDRVEFTRSLTEDLKRRDFTVNAMAMDADGTVIDPFDGRRDLEDGILRAVGEPDERFREDGLRIMRALRFSSVLGFTIEKRTEDALFRNRQMLAKLSVERIFGEFKKLVTGKNAGDVLRRYIDVLGVVFPELLAMKGFQQHNEYHRYDVLEHCVRAMEAVRTVPENRLHMKMAALFHDVGKPLTYSQEDNGRGHFFGHASKGAEVTARIMERFRADRALSERVVTLVRYHDLIFQEDEGLLKKWMRRFTPEVLFEILEIKRADNLATGNMGEPLKAKFSRIASMMDEIIRQGQCFSLKSLAVDGNDLMELGVKQGPEVGRILERLLTAVVEEEVPNDRERLLELARESIGDC